VSDLLLRATLATLVAIVGGGIGVLAGTLLGRITALVGTAAGALLAVTLVSILPEAAHRLPHAGFVLAVVSGYLLLFLIGKYVFPICPACAGEAMKARAAARQRGGVVALLAFVVTLHSVIDGMAVAVGHKLHESDDLPLLFAVSLHKLPEGLALAALLLRAGWAPRAALIGTVVIESTTLLGAALGQATLGGLSPFWLGALLAHAGGGFIYLALHTLLAAAPVREKAAQISYGTLGFASVALLLWGLQR
jgi:zinc transporter ZupT